MIDDLVAVVFCDSHYNSFVLQNQLKETRRRSSRESSRERKIFSSWERLWILRRWVWRRREVCLSLSSDSLKAWITVCPKQRSAQTAVEDSERIFTELIHSSIERSCSDLIRLIRDQEKQAVRSSWRKTGATGAGDQWSEEERCETGAAFTHTDHIQFLQVTQI